MAAPQRAARPNIAAPRSNAAPNRGARIQQMQQQRQNARDARRQGRQQQATPAAQRDNGAPNRAAARQQRIEQQRTDRAERQLQRRENRAIRNLPPAQRAARRQELQQQRAQRVQQLQQNLQNQNAQPLNRNAAPQRAATRRNGQPRIDARAAWQGRFAAAALAARQGAQGARADRRDARAARLIARQAWRRGLRASFVPWAGAVFWPYAYSDLFDYTFFPYSYEDDYWAYAYDDMFDGVFYADGGPYSPYPASYAYAPATTGLTGRAASAQARATDKTAQDACRDPGQGVTAWPFAQIERAVQLNGDQKKLLADFRNAAGRAAATFKEACTSNAALTPPGRLQNVTRRLEATLEAVQIVKTPLDAFYNSLSDEQKARFNLIGPTLGQSQKDKTARQDTLGANAKSCKDAKPGLVALPIETIEDTVKPTEQQQGALDKLEQATNDAVGKLASACPDDIPQTPTGRLEAAETRLKAMIEAARTVQPALDEFYASLSDEQKSRFNTMQGATQPDNG